MIRQNAAWLADAAREIEKVLRAMGDHYIEWSNLDTECSFISCLARVDSAKDFHSQITVLFGIMDHHIDSIQDYLTNYLISTIRTIEINFPITNPAGAGAGTAAAAAQDEDEYPSLEAMCLGYWNSKISTARALTNKAKGVLKDLPADRARLERLDRTMPGYRLKYEQVVILCNAPVDKKGNVEFKLELKELMEIVKAMIEEHALVYT